MYFIHFITGLVLVRVRPQEHQRDEILLYRVSRITYYWLYVYFFFKVSVVDYYPRFCIKQAREPRYHIPLEIQVKYI